MKKIFLFTAIAALFALASCSKDKEGVYAPKSKISSIISTCGSYDANGNAIEGPETSTETWNWDGDLLSSINTEFGVEKFSYDEKDRVINVSIPEEHSEIKFTYDGKFLSAIECNQQGFRASKITFEHDGKKIKSMKVVSYYEDFDEEKVLSLVLGKQMASTITRISKMNAVAKKSAKAEEDFMTYNFTWDGDNISTMEIKGWITATIDYQYDNKKNPYYHLYSTEMIEGSEFGMINLSKNNITSATLKINFMGMSETETVEFEYTYENKYPATCTSRVPVQGYSYEQDPATGEWIQTEYNYFEVTTTTFNYTK